MPNRLIKESIARSDKVNQMSDFQFRVWVHLITYVDDYGRGDARPAIIKGSCFPLRERMTNKDIEAALKALAGIGCISLYEVDGKPYLYFPNWGSHQNIRNKKSKFPAPPDRLRTDESICDQLQSNDRKCSRNPIQSESESESESPPTPQGGSGEGADAHFPESQNLQAAFVRWMAYKRERREAYKPIGEATLVRKIKQAAADCGESAVIEAIESAISNGWKGIVWDKLPKKPEEKPKEDKPAVPWWQKPEFGVHAPGTTGKKAKP